MADPIDEHPAVAVPQKAKATNGITSIEKVVGVVSAAATAVVKAVGTAVEEAAEEFSKTLEQRLVKLFAKDKRMANVRVKPWWDSTLPKPLQGSDVTAWTNSSTVIYIKPLDPQLPEVLYDVVLYHEGLHIQQFRREGGHPPTYQKMVEHEIEAYGETASWLEKNAARLGIDSFYVNQIVPDFRRKAAGFRANLTDALKKEAKDREPLLKAFLRGNNNLGELGPDGVTHLPFEFLPDHNSLSELYKPSR